MVNKEWIALVLAGGAGTRLKGLTKRIDKPAIPFGGKYRLIDFSLSNCCNSGIDTIGVLTPPIPFPLQDRMVGTIHADGVKTNSSLYVLPPKSEGRLPYKGTADAVYQNVQFIKQWHPSYVLILSGDHIYKMDYRPFLAFHQRKNADLTVAGIEVPWDEACRFGIFHTRQDQSIATFIEKPIRPDSNLASMGIYIFSWPYLEKILEKDAVNFHSQHDFGKNVIPAAIAGGAKIVAYPFAGYWQDVGTVQSFYNAHMDLLGEQAAFDLNDEQWPIYTSCPNTLSHVQITLDRARNSLISSCSIINGDVADSVIFPGTRIGKGARVRRSVIMTGAYVGDGQDLAGTVLCPCALARGQNILKAPDSATKITLIETADLKRFSDVISVSL